MTRHPRALTASDLTGIADWRTSSFSDNGQNCVEVADLVGGADWFTSSYSDNGLNCVEVASLTHPDGRAVAVRDSKQSDGPVLLFTADAFAAFIADTRAGRYGA
jgi:hypothetical protein